MTTKTISPGKQKIAEAAQKHFRKNGYAATSMRDLAEDVGVEASSLYNHIGGKEEILEHICFGMAKQFFAALEESVNEKHGVDKQLESALRAHIGIIVRNSDASAVFFHDWRHLSKMNVRKFTTMREEYEERFRRMVSRGMREEIFIKGDIRVMVRTIFSAVNGIYDWYNPKGSVSPAALADQLTGMILSGIKK